MIEFKQSTCPTNKRRFVTAIEADAIARDLAARGKFDPQRGIPNAYWCDECHAWHLGNRRPNDPEPVLAGKIEREPAPDNPESVPNDELATVERCAECLGWLDEAQQQLHAELRAGPPCDPPPYRWFKSRNERLEDIKAARLRVHAWMGVVGRRERAAKHAEYMVTNKDREARKRYLFIRAVEAMLPEAVFRGLWDQAEKQLQEEGWK